MADRSQRDQRQDRGERIADSPARQPAATAITLTINSARIKKCPRMAISVARCPYPEGRVDAHRLRQAFEAVPPGGRANSVTIVATKPGPLYIKAV